MSKARSLRWITIVGLAVLGLVFTGKALWIPAKAALAQHLLERAWQRTLLGQPGATPWPWADTWPVARLLIGGRKLVVLTDSGGEGLAFGPTHVAGSAPPGAHGTTVISAHRDTHFKGLDRIKPGAVIGLETADGKSHTYRVTGSQVLPTPRLTLVHGSATQGLVLVTCWPLDGAIPGRPERFVLHAKAVAGRLKN